MMKKGPFAPKVSSNSFISPKQKKKDNLDDFIENELKGIKKDNPGFEENPNFQQPAPQRPQDGQSTPSMPSQPKKVGGSKPFQFKPGQIKKAPLGSKPVDSSHASPDVSRTEPSGQSTLPKGIPSSVKKPNFAMKPKAPVGSKPLMAGGIGAGKKIGFSSSKKRQEEEFDEEVESLMPESMKRKDGNTSFNMEKPPARVDPSKIVSAAPTMMGGKKVGSNILGPKKMQNNNFANNSRLEKKPVAAKDESGSDGYSDEDNFEEDKDTGEDPMEKMRQKMKRENEKALNKQNLKVINNQPDRGASPNTSVLRMGPKAGPKPQASGQFNPMGAQGGFAEVKQLVIAPQVDHEAQNKQEHRAHELRELIQLGTEENFNMFEMVPKTPIDAYFNKLTGGSLKTAVVSTTEDDVERGDQTEEIELVNKFNQAPDDFMESYDAANGYQRKKRRENEALLLEKFMSRAGPLLETILEENDQIRFIKEKGALKNPAVQQSGNLKFPQELAFLFSQTKIQEDEEEENPQPNVQQPAEVKRITAIHFFEATPQSKFAVAYHLKQHDGKDCYIVVIFHVRVNQIMRICYSDVEITKMCTHGEDDVLICATNIGSLMLYDLKDYQQDSYISRFLNWEALTHYMQSVGGNEDCSEEALRGKYTPKTVSFITDGMQDYPHMYSIEKLMLVSKVGAGSKQIGVLDSAGIVSMWSVLEMADHVAEKMAEFELNMSVGSKFKLIQNFNQDLTLYAADTTGLTLEFDQNDSNKFFFGCTSGLYAVDRKISPKPTMLATDGLGSTSALSMSDDKYLIAGFTCGSVALYNTEFTSPLTVWWNATKFAIRELRWCSLYFSDDSAGQSLNDSPQKKKQRAERKTQTRYKSRLCEFFLIDQEETFQIWNMLKEINKPSHLINFGEKHAGQQIFRISLTIQDQRFYSAFALKDNSTSIYTMNFKKGSGITKEKLAQENKKSLRIISTLPHNAGSELVSAAS